MKRMKLSLMLDVTTIMLTLSAALVSCALLNKYDPPIKETPRDGYPCGIDGVACLEQNDAGALYTTGMCCGQGQVCGGHWPNVGCPPGQCCDDGDNGEGARRSDAGPMHIVGPQHKAR